MLYAANLTLRLAMGVCMVACVGLGAAKVWGVGFNHSLILVYNLPVPYLPKYPMVLVDVERNLFSRIRMQDINISHPDCSVNGQVVFVSPPYLGGIYAIDMFGEDLTQIVSDWDATAYPSWSPDGMQLAFLSYSTLNSVFYQDVFVTDLIADVPQPLTQQYQVQESPVWSPDGSQLLFTAARDAKTEIYTVNLAGNIHRLTNNAATEKGPIWSPNGAQIAFSSDERDDSSIYVMDSDGSNLRQLTQNDASEYFPAWSPDGKTIAFAYYDQHAQVRVMEADGKNQHILAELAPRDAPVWSPDGRYLIVISENFSDAKGNIYLINVNESSHRVLVHSETSSASVAWCP